MWAPRLNGGQDGAVTAGRPGCDSRRRQEDTDRDAKHTFIKGSASLPDNGREAGPRRHVAGVAERRAGLGKRR